MKLSDLQEMGAFVSTKLIQREVKFQRPELKPASEWTDPDIPEMTGEVLNESMTVWIRRGSAADAIELMQAARREQPFVAIYRSVCNKDGSPVFESIEQAESLQLWLAMPLFEAITEVAGNGPKASRRRTSSGLKQASPTASRKRS